MRCYLPPAGRGCFQSFGDPFRRDIDIGIDINLHMDVDSDMAVSVNWGSFMKRLRTLLKGVWG